MDDDGPPVLEPCFSALDSLAIPAVNVDTMLQLDGCPLSWVELYPERYRYLSPSFNPNNTEEIAFVRRDNEAFEFRLCILNLCTGKLDILEAEAFKDVDWGANGWILFRKLDLQLWKIRPDGSGQERLTSLGENSDPIWDNNGERIAYSLTNTGEFFILDSEGNVLETIESMRHRGAFDWSEDDYLITGGEQLTPDSYYIGYYDINNDLIKTTNDVGGQHYIYDAKWGENNRLYWLLQYRLAYTDIETGEKNIVFSLPELYGFNNRFYRSFTISPDYKHIILNREDWKQIDYCHVEVVHSLYIMDIDGSNERKILIPE